MVAVYLFLNAFVFQAIWFVCVFFAASPWLFLVPALIACQLWFSKLYFGDAFSVARELKLIAVCIVVGIVVETIILKAHVWSTFNNDVVAPLWLIGIWAGFATTLNMSLKFLKGKPLLAAFFGALFSPLSYYGGSQLSSIYSISTPVYSLSVISVIWFFVLPLLVIISNRPWFSLPAGARANA